MKKITISVIMTILILFVLESLVDPHKPRKMLINDSENIAVDFGDNEIEITAVNWSKWILDYHHSIFYLYMYYDLTREVTVHKDVVRIKYEGRNIGHCGMHGKEGPIFLPN